MPAIMLVTGCEYVAPEQWERVAAGCLRRIMQRKGLEFTQYVVDELIDAIVANIWHLYRALPYRVPIDARYIYNVAKQCLAYWQAKRSEEREAVSNWAVGVQGDDSAADWDGANGMDEPDDITELDRLLARVEKLNQRCNA